MSIIGHGSNPGYTFSETESVLAARNARNNNDLRREVRFSRMGKV